MITFSEKPSSVVSRSHPLEINKFGLSLVCLTPMLGGFLYGVDIGATSFVLSMLLSTPTRTSLLDDDGDNGNHNSTTTTTNANWDANSFTTTTTTTTISVWWSDLSSVQQGLIVSALSLGALLGSHIIFHCSHSSFMGRRMELRICALLYLIGTIFNVLSGTWFQTNKMGFPILFLGRLLFGIGVGFVMHGAPAYLAEMCPAHIRGAVVSAKETVIVGGIVFGYAIGNWMSSGGYKWTDLYAISLLVAFPMLVLTFLIPRSKRWLLLKGGSENRQEAYEAMKFIYVEGQEGLEEEFQKLVSKLETQVAIDDTTQATTTTISGERYGSTEDPCSLDACCADQPSNDDDDDDNDESNRPKSLWSRRYRNAMIPSLGLVILQQCSGQPSVLSYATVLFQVAGWSGNASVITAILMMATSMSTVLLVDRVGRKQMLCACCLIMMSASTTMAYSFWGWTSGTDDSNNTAFFDRQEQLTVLVAMFVYIGGYQVGFGPITWCIVSEIFPPEIRGQAIAVGVELNYALNFLVQFLFPLIQESLGWGPSFGLFAVILVFAFWFVETIVPETTGLTLEEIEVKLQMNKNKYDDDVETKFSLKERAPLLALDV